MIQSKAKGLRTNTISSYPINVKGTGTGFYPSTDPTPHLWFCTHSSSISPIPDGSEVEEYDEELLGERKTKKKRKGKKWEELNAEQQASRRASVVERRKRKRMKILELKAAGLYNKKRSASNIEDN